MTGDHYGRNARRATLLVRAVDALLGTHTYAWQPSRGSVTMLLQTLVTGAPR